MKGFAYFQNLFFSFTIFPIKNQQNEVALIRGGKKKTFSGGNNVPQVQLLCEEGSPGHPGKIQINEKNPPQDSVSPLQSKQRLA